MKSNYVTRLFGLYLRGLVVYNIIILIFCLIKGVPSRTTYFVGICYVLAVLSIFHIVDVVADYRVNKEIQKDMIRISHQTKDIVRFDGKENKSYMHTAYDAINNATAMDENDIAVTMNPPLAGLIVLRDESELAKVLSKGTCRELKIKVDLCCYIEGIGVLLSDCESIKMPQDVHVLVVLNDYVITDDTFLGHHRISSMDKENVEDDWMNVLIPDEMDGGLPHCSPVIIRGDEEPTENLFAALKEWREKHTA